PTLGCCGDVGQRVCVVHSVFSDCSSACKPGLVYNAAKAACDYPCSYCSDAGFCCGDYNQTACLLGSGCTGNDGCKSGLVLRFNSSALLTCLTPCSYCLDAGVCCGAVGQTACLLGATGQADCTGNGGCAPGNEFYAKYGVCGPNPVPEKTYLNGSAP